MNINCLVAKECQGKVKRHHTFPHQAYFRYCGELWKAKDKNSVLSIHDLQEHMGVPSKYQMKIIRKYSNAFERQQNEPMRIKLAKTGTNLNSKTEWHSQEVERLRLTQVGEARSRHQNALQRHIGVDQNIQIIINNTSHNSNKVGRPKGSQNRKVKI